MPSRAVQHFPENPDGRDFAVGDIHGMFSSLDALLDEVDFDPDRDRLFSVGDLIDRGPESHRALDFLEQPWFHAIQGNHERLMLDAVHPEGDMQTWVNINGGEWWLDVDEDLRNRFVHVIRELPIAIDIHVGDRRVGIIHADVAQGMSWDEFLQALEEDPEAVNYAVWSRTRLRMAEISGDAPPVEGVDLLICGHTPLKNAVQVANIYYLDTAAAYASSYEDAKLTMMEFSPGFELYEHITQPADPLLG
ncbi:MAG: phosphoprotein phosphatase [Gammaproteobacteria bacterium]|nr:MAG: phosphoprotein phosphatase [Gammaproteobacteria bacterium]